jgi:NAD(P)H-flavin reductase
MVNYTGRVVELQLEIYKKPGAVIACPPQVAPQAGQYVLAHAVGELNVVLAQSVFPASLITIREDQAYFVAAAPIAENWRPGTELALRGPVGRGFTLPRKLGCLALVALTETAGRLMPLAQKALEQGAEVALFCDLTAPLLPTEIEVLPVNTLIDSMDWPDFMAIDVNLLDLPSVRSVLGGKTHTRYPVQVLVNTAMPCGSVGECGVCAVPVRNRKWMLACKDGPVFDLTVLRL